MSFRITMGKGFQMTFANGNTISVQFGPGNYCEHYNGDLLSWFATRAEDIDIKSSDCEVATWDADGNWNLREYIEASDCVKGNMSAEEVLDLMIKVAGRK